VLNAALFWFVVVIFAAGHLLLLRSAWRLRHSQGAYPAGAPRSDPRTDLLWTLLTAAASACLLVAVFFALQ